MCPLAAVVEYVVLRCPGWLLVWQMLDTGGYERMVSCRRRKPDEEKTSTAAHLLAGCLCLCVDGGGKRDGENEMAVERNARRLDEGSDARGDARHQDSSVVNR